jgi:hypothetical protein
LVLLSALAMVLLMEPAMVLLSEDATVLLTAHVTVPGSAMSASSMALLSAFVNSLGKLE